MTLLLEPVLDSELVLSGTQKLWLFRGVFTSCEKGKERGEQDRMSMGEKIEMNERWRARRDLFSDGSSSLPLELSKGSGDETYQNKEWLEPGKGRRRGRK